MIESKKIPSSNLASCNLNGSLLSLKLNDEFKSPSNNFQSAFHTPPPSRSSSLLSLASHHSSGNNFINNDSSSKSLPFQQYRSSNTLIENFSSSTKFNQVAGKKRKVSNLVSSSASSVVSSSRYSASRPLISPAKFNNSTTPSSEFSSSRNTDFYQRSSFPPSDFHQRSSVSFRPSSRQHHHQTRFSPIRDCSMNSMSCSSDNSLDGEITALDSISQVGGYTTPKKKSSNAVADDSSPRSTISSTFSMKTVEDVENSRLCKWLLAFCVLLNAVLVMLLILQVNDMRESEQWKQRNSL